MVPRITKNAGSFLDFKRQSNSPVNTNRPHIPFSPFRSNFIRVSVGKKPAVTQKFCERNINR